VQSSSGYLGVSRVCQRLKEHKEKGKDFCSAQQVRTYLFETKMRIGSGPRDALSTEHTLARALAHFAITAEVKHLEAIVRLKARLMALEKEQTRRRVRHLFGSRQAVQEVKEMTQQNGEIPDLPIQLTWTIANWFKDREEHPKGTEWLGDFIKLENSASRDRFLYEVERVIRHASSKNLNAYSAFGSEREKLAEAAALQSPSAFRAYKALFLLDVLSKLAEEIGE
jgi:hypothetical protein